MESNDSHFWRVSKSENKDWNTPQKIVIAIRKFFGGNIDLDPCSNVNSIVHAHIEYKLPQDGLKLSWNFPTIYVNPPYGSGLNNTSIADWFKKIVKTYCDYNSEIIALVPVATNTTYWSSYVYPYASRICFLYDSRLKFRIQNTEDNKGSPMACCLIYWGKNPEKFYNIFASFGGIIQIIQKNQPKKLEHYFTK